METGQIMVAEKRKRGKQDAYWIAISHNTDEKGSLILVLRLVYFFTKNEKSYRTTKKKNSIKNSIKIGDNIV